MKNVLFYLKAFREYKQYKHALELTLTGGNSTRFQNYIVVWSINLDFFCITKECFFDFSGKFKAICKKTTSPSSSEIHILYSDFPINGCERQVIPTTQAELFSFVVIPSSHSLKIWFTLLWDNSDGCLGLEPNYQTVDTNYDHLWLNLQFILFLLLWYYSTTKGVNPQHILLLEESVEEDSSISFFLFCRRALSRVTLSVWVYGCFLLLLLAVHLMRALTMR